MAYGDINVQRMRNIQSSLAGTAGRAQQRYQDAKARKEQERARNQALFQDVLGKGMELTQQFAGQEFQAGESELQREHESSMLDQRLANSLAELAASQEGQRSLAELQSELTIAERDHDWERFDTPLEINVPGYGSYSISSKPEYEAIMARLQAEIMRDYSDRQAGVEGQDSAMALYGRAMDQNYLDDGEEWINRYDNIDEAVGAFTNRIQGEPESDETKQVAIQIFRQTYGNRFTGPQEVSRGTAVPQDNRRADRILESLSDTPQQMNNISQNLASSGASSEQIDYIQRGLDMLSRMSAEDIASGIAGAREAEPFAGDLVNQTANALSQHIDSIETGTIHPAQINQIMKMIESLTGMPGSQIDIYQGFGQSPEAQTQTRYRPRGWE